MRFRFRICFGFSASDFARVEFEKGRSRENGQLIDEPILTLAHMQGRNPAITVRASAPVNTPSWRSCRTRLPPLWLKRCPRNALRCFALPDAVTLNRFFIPLCVFCFGIKYPHSGPESIGAKNDLSINTSTLPEKRGIIIGCRRILPALP